MKFCTIETLEKVHFVRLDVYCMVTQSYNVIFRYELDNIMNFNKQWLVLPIYNGMYDILAYFGNPCTKLLIHSTQMTK